MCAHECWGHFFSRRRLIWSVLFASLSAGVSCSARDGGPWTCPVVGLQVIRGPRARGISHVPSPNRVTAAQERVAKLEALAALHGVDGPEVESMRAALKRAKEVKVQPVDIECEGFLSRARAHLTELDAKRTTVSTNNLRCRTAVGSAETSNSFPHYLELRQLRETVAQMKEQLEVAKPVMVEGQASKRISKREDYVPNCMEELQEWIAGRQADLNEAMLVGRPDEVARISNIMCQAAQQSTRGCSWNVSIPW